jgi:ribosomal protein S18 acetylase RimI-like enzyme
MVKRTRLGAGFGSQGGAAMIRWKTPGDDSGIVDLVRTQLVPLSPRNHPRDGRLTQDVKTRLRRGATLVASKSRRGEPFGFLHMELRDDILFIDLLAVDSTLQNRHWGTELMQKAEQYGLAKGCTQARLFVDDTNHRGMRFYHKLGYSVVQHLKQLNCYELFKPLVPPYG